MNTAIKCDHEGCEKDSIGYANRQLQGPFYCAEHEKWALDLASWLLFEKNRIGRRFRDDC